MAVYLGDKIIYSGNKGGSNSSLVAELPADKSTPYDVQSQPARPLYSEWGSLQGEVNSCLGGYNSENFFVNILQALGLWQQDFSFTSAYGFIVDRDCDSITFSIGEYYATSTGVGGAKNVLNEDGTVTVRDKITLTDVKKGTRIVTAFESKTSLNMDEMTIPQYVSYVYFNVNLILTQQADGSIKTGSNDLFHTNTKSLRGFEFADNKNFVINVDSSFNVDSYSHSFSFMYGYTVLESLPKKVDFSGFTGDLNFAQYCPLLKQLPETLNIQNVSKISGFLNSSGCPEVFPYTFDLNLKGLNNFLNSTKGIKRIPKPLKFTVNNNIDYCFCRLTGLDKINSIELTVVNSDSSNYALSSSTFEQLKVQEIENLKIKRIPSETDNKTTYGFAGLQSKWGCNHIDAFTIEADIISSTATGKIMQCSQIDNLNIIISGDSATQKPELPYVEDCNISNIEITTTNALTVSAPASASYNVIEKLTINTTGNVAFHSNCNVKNLKKLNITTQGTISLSAPKILNLGNVVFNAAGNIDLGSNTLTCENLTIITTGTVSGGSNLYSIGDINIQAGSISGLLTGSNLHTVGNVTLVTTGDIANFLYNNTALVKCGNINATSDTKIHQLLYMLPVQEVGEVVLTAPVITNSVGTLKKLQSLKCTLNATNQINDCVYADNTTTGTGILNMENLEITATVNNSSNLCRMLNGLSPKHFKVNFDITCEIFNIATDIYSCLDITGSVKITSASSSNMNLFNNIESLKTFNCDVEISAPSANLTMLSNSYQLKTLDLGNDISVSSLSLGSNLSNCYGLESLTVNLTNAGILRMKNNYSLKKAFITLGNNNYTEMLVDCPLLTDESLAYIASNAPTVTSKTLKLNSAVYDTSKSWYQDLVNKGWTVSK